ncbi:hypothetical protein M422DRAFT_254871 [Sphaerobolus stellatus SS14]|uniref:Uncharacterized protein n=1 Tax=Sphaerobolus stellatus (strain SS14) TaxID=990650 RepID=A0A0C9V5I3_SPHS4|nr:hypothetical protein M422DRAFT_254871 [Sphaerobolus stellatus SS14]
MPFVPLPTTAVCDHSSRSSFAIAQAVSRTWRNPNPIDWHIIPESIDFRPDGTGTISSSFKVFTGQQVISDVASQEFFWKLGRDGPLGMEGIDLDALYHIFSKLMTSTRAWTTRTWTGGFVPAYFQIILSEQNSL